jgi:hypothetical protein
MKDVSKILYHRLVEKENKFSFFAEKFNLEKSEFDDCFKSISKAKDFFSNELIIKALKLFESKLIADVGIYKWNQKNPKVIEKKYSFSSYSRLDENGKSIKSLENFKSFYLDIKDQYDSQSKSLLQSDLPWIKDNFYIKPDDCVCYYCGVNEKILNKLYHDQKYTCKTKRNRGAWFELDRKDSSKENNIYSKENMVLCCYFCNNHKSDVISVEHMRHFFGEAMFSFLIDRYEYLNKFNPYK